MTKPDTSPGEARQEKLVAYLDGELSVAESERVEAQLGSDAELRGELSALDRAWNALDALPLAHTQPDFAKTTLAMAAATLGPGATEQNAGSPGQPVARRLRSWALVLMTACVSALLVVMAARHGDRRLLTELPVIEHATVLAQVGDATFLARLAQEAWLAEVAAGPQASAAVDEWNRLEGADRRERAAWIETLDDARAQQLAEKRDAFRAMSPPRRESLVELNERIRRSDEPSALRAAALVYQELVGELPPGERAELLSMASEERLERLRKLHARSSRTRRIELSAEELRAYRAALRAYAQTEPVRERVQSLLALVEESSQRFGPPPGRRRSPDRSAAARERLENEPELVFIHAARLNSGWRLPPLPAVQQLTESWRAWAPRLVAMLPESARGRVEQERSPARQARMLFPVLVEALQIEGQQDPARFFAEELTSDQIDALLLMPTEEMMRELKRLMAEDALPQVLGTPAPPGRMGPRDGRPPRPPQGFPRGDEPNRRGPGRSPFGPPAEPPF